MNVPIATPDPFEQEHIFILLEKDRNFEILNISRLRLSSEKKEQTEDMLIVLAKLFYEKVFKKSPAWRKESLKWKRKKKEWRTDFEESFKAFFEGREEAIILPPDGDSEDALSQGK